MSAKSPTPREMIRWVAFIVAVWSVALVFSVWPLLGLVAADVWLIWYVLRERRAIVRRGLKPSWIPELILVISMILWLALAVYSDVRWG